MVRPVLGLPVFSVYTSGPLRLIVLIIAVASGLVSAVLIAFSPQDIRASRVNCGRCHLTTAITPASDRTGDPRPRTGSGPMMSECPFCQDRGEGWVTLQSLQLLHALWALWHETPPEPDALVFEITLSHLERSYE